MQSYILGVVVLLTAVSCIPAPVDKTDSRASYQTFSIAPEGTWLPKCQDVAANATAILAHQLQLVFADSEPTFNLTRDFLATKCDQDKPEVSLRHHLKGNITYGKYADLDKDRRGRSVQVDVVSESYTPKSSAGLAYLRAVVSAEAGKQLSLGKEFVVPEQHRQYSKLHGMLVVKKTIRNAMHVYLDPQQKNAKDILSHLDNSNLYVRYVTK